MQHFDKALVGAEGFTFQVGTLGNPMAARAQTLEILSRDNAYETIISYGKGRWQHQTASMMPV